MSAAQPDVTLFEYSTKTERGALVEWAAAQDLERLDLEKVFVRSPHAHEVETLSGRVEDYAVLIRRGPLQGTLYLEFLRRPAGFATMSEKRRLATTLNAKGVYWRIIWPGGEPTQSGQLQ